MHALTSAAIGKVFRRLPDLKSELSNFSSLDLATREAWELACRDVLQAQAPGEVNIMQISREPVSAEASEWWPKVVAGERLLYSR